MKRVSMSLVLGGCIHLPVFAQNAVVNTPGDGFPALRSEPSTQQGSRLARIPHGTELELGECVRTSPTQRWCRTGYRGQHGWVLDTYVIRVTDSEVGNRSGGGTGTSDGADERAILQVVSQLCTPDWCRPEVERVPGRYATAVLACIRVDCDGAIAFLEKKGDTREMVDDGTGITAEDLIGCGFPAEVGEELTR
jgi:hypothetical protein